MKGPHFEENIPENYEAIVKRNAQTTYVLLYKIRLIKLQTIIFKIRLIETNCFVLIIIL